MGRVDGLRIGEAGKTRDRGIPGGVHLQRHGIGHGHRLIAKFEKVAAGRIGVVEVGATGERFLVEPAGRIRDGKDRGQDFQFERVRVCGRHLDGHHPRPEPGSGKVHEAEGERPEGRIQSGVVDGGLKVVELLRQEEGGARKLAGMGGGGAGVHAAGGLESANSQRKFIACGVAKIAGIPQVWIEGPGDGGSRRPAATGCVVDHDQGLILLCPKGLKCSGAQRNDTAVQQGLPIDGHPGGIHRLAEPEQDRVQRVAHGVPDRRDDGGELRRRGVGGTGWSPGGLQRHRGFRRSAGTSREQLTGGRESERILVGEHQSDLECFVLGQFPSTEGPVLRIPGQVGGIPDHRASGRIHDLQLDSVAGAGPGEGIPAKGEVVFGVDLLGLVEVADVRACRNRGGGQRDVCLGGPDQVQGSAEFVEAGRERGVPVGCRREVLLKLVVAGRTPDQGTGATERTGHLGVADGFEQSERHRLGQQVDRLISSHRRDCRRVVLNRSPPPNDLHRRILRIQL